MCISKLREQTKKYVTKREVLERIYYDFFENVYEHKNISNKTLRKIT